MDSVGVRLTVQLGNGWRAQKPCYKPNSLCRAFVLQINISLAFVLGNARQRIAVLA